MEINGTKVVDAKKSVTIHILSEDVAKGGVKDPGSCAAARACMRDLQAKAARVHVGRTYVLTENKWVRFQTSPSLRTEIVAFDRGGTFEPGDYTLLPCRPSLKLGSKRKKTPRERPGKNAKKRPYHTTANIRMRGANR